LWNVDQDQPLRKVSPVAVLRIDVRRNRLQRIGLALLD
jgi:hypothetical protein